MHLGRKGKFTGLSKREEVLALEIPEGVESKECQFCFGVIPKKAKKCRICQANLVSSSLEEGEGFAVEREEVETQLPNGETRKFSKVTVIIKDENIKLNLSYHFRDPQIYEKEPHVAASDLLTVLPSLRSYREEWISGGNDTPYPLEGLMNFLEHEFNKSHVNYDELIKSGVVTYEALQYLFQIGKKFMAYEYDYLVASEVESTRYQRNEVFHVNFFVVAGQFIKSDGHKFFQAPQEFQIFQFKGAMKISELPIQPLDEESEKLLKERGKIFREVGIGHHYKSFKGKMFVRTHMGFFQNFKADGRIMIDTVSFNKIIPDYGEFSPPVRYHYNARGEYVADTTAQSVTTIPDEELYKTWCSLGGFSFTAKKWGEFAIGSIFSIEYDDKAYEKLILEGDRKILVECLVLHSDKTFTDFINGKGAGCIFLCHGPPGTGKTLTAEAIAEKLHRPLYNVSAGELGTTTEKLEVALKDILDVASVWNAVVLIDEADIFLEKRGDNDIKRNGMVGIFLRLLEYHQGILFLTTNRVQSFDEAFHSRISIGLKYNNLPITSREQIWKNFLEVAGVVGINATMLSKFNLNGRQIRTTVRLAQALAKSEKTPLVDKHFERTIAVTSPFGEEMKKKNESEEKNLKQFIPFLAVSSAVATGVFLALKL